jgi:ribosome-associated heat shock protein Hsp15
MTRAASDHDDAIRLDKWLWYARFFKSRSLAQTFVAEENVRVNRQKVAKPAAIVHVGDVLTLAFERGVLVVEVLDLGERRGPAREARGLYRTLFPETPVATLPAAAHA